MQESDSIARNLTIEARSTDMLILWTDCDREGEAIGFEIAQHCQKAQRRLIVKRACFSAVIAEYVAFFHANSNVLAKSTMHV